MAVTIEQVREMAESLRKANASLRRTRREIGVVGAKFAALLFPPKAGCGCEFAFGGMPSYRCVACRKAGRL